MQSIGNLDGYIWHFNMFDNDKVKFLMEEVHKKEIDMMKSRVSMIFTKTTQIVH